MSATVTVGDKTFNLTNGRLIILRELQDGPKQFMQLRTAYFGPARAEGSATTAFYNQLVKNMGEKHGLVMRVGEKGSGKYQLTTLGTSVLEAAKAQGVDFNVKSEAQLKFEVKQS